VECFVAGLKAGGSGFRHEGFGTIAMIVNFVASAVKVFTEPPKMFKILWSMANSHLVQEKQHIKINN
jgi:hypothetical protein